MNKTIEVLYNSFIESEEQTTAFKDLTDNLNRISRETDEKLEAGRLTSGDLAEYQEAAAHEAYYAGFYAAMELFRGMGR